MSSPSAEAAPSLSSHSTLQHAGIISPGSRRAHLRKLQAGRGEGHPECPARIDAVAAALEASGVGDNLQIIPVREAEMIFI